MLGEIALTPDVLLLDTHEDMSVASVYLQMIKEPLLQEVMVRNLWNGEWHKSLVKNNLSPRGRELLKKLFQQKRLRVSPGFRENCPDSDVCWCQEAIESHSEDAVDCVLTTQSTEKQYNEQHAKEPLIAVLERVNSHVWWKNRSSSVRLRRTIDDYLKHLGRLLKCSNSLMFIDPHFDPSERRYREFSRILERASRQTAPVRVEIHRVFQKRDNREKGGRYKLENNEWEELFKEYLKPKISHCSLSVEIFIWKDFHDRYLISDLMGISVPNGFDIDFGETQITTWTRLGRDTRDDVYREFDPAYNPDNFMHRFCLFT